MAGSGLVSLFSGVILFLSVLSALILARALRLSDVGSFRSTLVSSIRIAFYTTLIIATIGSRHYLLYGLQKEYIAVALPAFLTVVYGALGFFMPAGSSIRSELLTVARFPICWSVILLAISGNMKESLVDFLVLCPAGGSGTVQRATLRVLQAKLRGICSNDFLYSWFYPERRPFHWRL